MKRILLLFVVAFTSIVFCNARDRFYIKIPIDEAGLKAAMQLKKENIGVLMTAIFTPMQALLSARAGAALVAPYVNRLDMVNGGGVQTVADIVKTLEGIRFLRCSRVASMN